METAPTAERLAQELDRVGLKQMAQNARENLYHDYLSPHAMPEHLLAAHLAEAAKRYPGMSDAILGIRQDVIEGKHDASKEEADAWAASPEGKEVFAQLTSDILKPRKGNK